jgi:signal transduction histidine kinase
MSTSESDPGQTGPQETTPAVQGVAGSEADGEQTPQALWAQLRHELRTPLDAIIGYSELLLGGAADLGQTDFIANLNLIHAAGHQLLGIINNLLDTTKFASGDVVFNLASLVANLHYKVRLPINDVIGVSDTPLLKNAAEQGRLDLIADLKKIQSAAEYVHSYINEIIDFGKIDAGLKKSGAKDSERLSLIDHVMMSLRGLAQDSAAVTGYESGSILVLLPHGFFILPPLKIA